MDNSWLSLIPPVATLLSALLTKRIIPSLALGLITGGFLVSKSLINGTIVSGEYIVEALASPESVYIVLFLFLFGALTEIFKISGGIKGFSILASRYAKDEKGVLLSV